MNYAMSKVFVTIIACLGLPLAANAQYWGTGMAPAMMGCQSQMGMGATNKIDGIRELAKEWKKKKALADKDEREIAKIQRQMDRDKKAIDAIIGEDKSEVIYLHIDSGYSCNDYRSRKAASSESNLKPGDTLRNPPAKANGSATEVNMSRMPASERIEDGALVSTGAAADHAMKSPDCCARSTRSTSSCARIGAKPPRRR